MSEGTYSSKHLQIFACFSWQSGPEPTAETQPRTRMPHRARTLPSLSQPQASSHVCSYHLTLPSSLLRDFILHHQYSLSIRMSRIQITQLTQGGASAVRDSECDATRKAHVTCHLTGSFIHLFLVFSPNTRKNKGVQRDRDLSRRRRVPFSLLYQLPPIASQS